RLDNDLVFSARLSGSGFPTLTGHTLTATGTVTESSAIADPFGGSSASALFTGAGSRLSTGVSEDFLPGTLYTIRGWAYVDSLSVSTGIVFIGTVGSGTDRTQIIINTDGSINFYSQGASQVFNITSAAGVITTGNWFFFEAVRDRTEAFLFINGTQVTYGLAAGTETTGSNLHLGYGLTSGTDRGLTGRLFDVQFSRRAEHRGAYSVPTSLLPFDGDKVAWIYDSVTAG
ncbi:LamG-like jellyroll fold domain-containing protein, partial [Candidatus Accumulibacter vicinus]|uniref:LamG-like jellyroll fold domain-containing protein n=1 Tax=Candidatus Accumulibacter vicinus TaxID=2954382 RepID=UPI00235B617C